MNTDDAFRLVLGFSRKGAPPDRKKFNRTMRQRGGGGSRTPEVMVKITSFGCDSSETTAHMNYVSRNGKVQMYDSFNNEISKEDAISEMQETLEEQESRDHGRTKRRTCHFILSMPAGTNKEGFRNATEDFLQEEFGDNHDHYHAFHDDSKGGSYHAHVIVVMEGKDFTRLDPNKNDISRWRTTFADKLIDNGIAARATTSLSRGEFSKNVPTYKYHKNIGRVVEHGDASYKEQAGAMSSYFVLLDVGEDENGNRKTKTVWSRSLKEPMEQAERDGLLGGGDVKLQRSNVEKMSFEKNVYGSDGKKSGVEEINYTKIEWEIKTGAEVQHELGIKQNTSKQFNARYIEAWRKIYDNAKEMKDQAAADGVVKTVTESFDVDEKTFTKEKSRSKNTVRHVR